MADGFVGMREADASAAKTSNNNTHSKTENQVYGNRPVRIIVVDNRRLYREGVRLLIERIDPGLDVVDADSVDRIGLLMEQTPGPGVVLYNLVASENGGMGYVGILSQSLGDMPLIVMCDTNDGEIMRGVLEHGAKAFLPSTTSGPLLVAILHLVIAGGIYAPPDMVVRVSSTANGAHDRIGTDARREQVIEEHFQMLTPRQRHVLALLSQGLSNRDIAGSLDMCENTVKAHVKQIMHRLRAQNRTQAALMADRMIA
jgi:DNA-binding NarL/FixJ family response regulator